MYLYHVREQDWELFTIQVLAEIRINHLWSSQNCCAVGLQKELQAIRICDNRQIKT